MKEHPSWLTPKQAAELAGYSARHIQLMITAGKLSASKEDGKYYIEKSEFFRMFPKAHKEEKSGNISQQLAEKKQLEFENHMLKDMASQKDKEIHFLRIQVENVSTEKAKMLDAIVTHIKLLGHTKEKEVDEKSSSKKGRWRKIFTLKK